MNLTPDDPKLTAYALGELEATERAAVEAALARSPECRRAVAEIQALAGELTTELAADAATATVAPVGRDSVEPHLERSEASAASISASDVPSQETRFARASSVGKWGSTESRPTAAPAADNILFLPQRHWRTLGMAAAAAVVFGFILAKVWRTEPAPQLVQHRITEKPPAPGPQVPAPAATAQRPTNQVAQAATAPALPQYTNMQVTVTRTNGYSGGVSVNFGTANGTALAGVDYVVGSGPLTFTNGQVTELFASSVAYSDSIEPRGNPLTAGNYSLNSSSAQPRARAYWAFQPIPRPASSGATPSPVLAQAERSEWFYNGVANNLAWGIQRHSGPAYPRYVENPFTLVASEPLSTFSTDVDTASYANVRRFLNQNQLPPADAVRIEELLNYFTYDYAPPTGEHPFAAHIEVAGCPWASEHRLVRVGLKGRELKADKRPPSNFVFLIDVSGSMSPATRLPLIKQSLRQLVKRMTENDRVAMVVYASSSGTVLESTSAVNKEVILAAIDRLEAGGSTNGGEGIQRAYDLAVANFIKGGVNRVLLCTDGDFNVGITDRGQLLKLIEEKAKSGVFLTTLGVGDDNFKDATLQQLADRGNGNYHYLDSVEEGHKVLVEQMNATLVTIAKDVKIQIEFNPAQAAAYRLIGYEKRILAKEDFNNDAKDAGEIGAGHTVTALYEVVPPGVQLRGPVDPLKYQTNNQPAPAPAAKATSTSKELLTLKLRYKAPDGDKSKLMELPVTDSRAPFARASADFKFASAVVEFGMLLKDSPFKGTATFASALELAGEGKGDDRHGYRAEFINLVAKAKSLKK